MHVTIWAKFRRARVWHLWSLVVTNMGMYMLRVIRNEHDDIEFRIYKAFTHYTPVTEINREFYFR